MNLKICLFIYFTITIQLFILSKSTFLNVNNLSNRELQQAETEKPQSPLDKTIAELSFMSTANGQTYLKAFLDKEFLLADKNSDKSISEAEIENRLKEIFAFYQIPTGSFSDSMIKLVLEDAQKDENSDLSREEFDKAMTKGVGFISSHLLTLKGTPYEALINTSLYIQEAKEVQKEDSTVEGKIKQYWKTVSQGYSTINNDAASQFISGVAFTMGLDTGKSSDIKKYVDDESKSTLNYNNFYNAFRKTMELTENYLESTVLPQKKEAVDKYNLSNQQNIVSIFSK